MNKGGTLLYRCRHCGVFEKNPHVPDLVVALTLAAIGAPFPSDWGGLSYGLTTTHFCGPGQYGVADLIGGNEDDDGAP
jgi:hypothetical protein